jgi:alpha-amylase/alpha-mannosidase (GH57 family)
MTGMARKPTLPSEAPPPAAPGQPAQAATPQRYLCVHGHFYQPPRENPWLETVELQDSAAPYHDWNERITSECYAPNGASRITNRDNKIVRIVNNYSQMSFNFGPTLLSWLEEFAPRTYRMIQDADQTSAERFSGHGSALAQVYNHIIMPLASERDARTQVRWGIADFEHRFGRRPEGMWLAETAVSRAVLDILAQERIRYTVLAPHQCARIRKLTGATPLAAADLAAADLGAPSSPTVSSSAKVGPATAPPTPWTETPNALVDPTQPYLVRLDNGRSIAVFFYDGPASRAIAFEGLLNDGKTFASRLTASFQPNNPNPQLAHVATDGESYGHHHKHGEMALSYALHTIEENHLAQLTNYGEYLERFPPTWEAEVVDNSSWSCVHGVERWRSNCGCNGGKAGWNQLWRAPLRDALDLLRDRTAPLAEAVAKPLLKDLWAARDAYIHVILDRSQDNLDRFLKSHATHELTPAERVTVFELLELERHTQLMYTSCGWFFDEISGIETVQIIAYAGRVIQLAAKLFANIPTNTPTNTGVPHSWTASSSMSGEPQTPTPEPPQNPGAPSSPTASSSAKVGLPQTPEPGAPQTPEPGAGAPHLASEMWASAKSLESDFLAILARAKSNVPDIGDGAEVYRRFVTAGRLDLESVGAHYAISSMFRSYPDKGQIFCFDVLRHSYDVMTSGRGRFAVGRAELQSRITEESEPICFAVLHLGDQNLSAAVKRFTPEDEATWATFVDASRASVRRANLPELIRLIDHFFGGPLYSFTSLFADEQQRILKGILNQTLSEVEGSLMRIYAEHSTLLDFLAEANIPAPPALALTASFAINASLRHALEADTYDASEVARLLRRAEIDHVTLDHNLLSYTADKRMKRAMVRLEAAAEQQSAQNLTTLNETLAIAESLQTLPMEVNLWQAQNIWNDLLRRSDTTYWSREWRENFRRIGLALNISVDDLVIERNVRSF